MINNLGTIKIDKGVEYLSDWKDTQGNFLFDQFLGNSKLIVNKKVTGCGFTTYCLINNENTILISPRIRLIRSKMNKFSHLYYFNREISKKRGRGSNTKTTKDLQKEFISYYTYCNKNNRPLKLMVTYDSFITLVSMLKSLGIDINSMFRLVIDESHTLVKDVKLKEYQNKCILSDFLTELFNYDKLLFISATPIIEYVSQIPQFMSTNIDYLELSWYGVSMVNVRSYGCVNPTDAFDKIYDYYQKNGYFDIYYYPSGNKVYSKEAVIFLNSVIDIRRIVNKYVVKNSLIDIKDISVICADNRENRRDLHKTHDNLCPLERIPEQGEPRTRWTFVTRTAFEGVDFYSDNASTYVIASYKVENLSLDIASDIPQIIGRQRLKENVFRSTLNIYFVDSLFELDKDRFKEWQIQKMNETKDNIRMWKSMPTPKDKDRQLFLISCTIDRAPNYSYLKTVNGIPEIDYLLVLSENYCMDILLNHVTWYTISSPKILKPEISQLKHDVLQEGNLRDKIRVVCDFIKEKPYLMEDVFDLLHDIQCQRIAYYLTTLPIERIIANSYDPWAMDKEIDFIDRKGNISDYVSSVFRKGEVYLAKDVKWMLQEVYDKLGILKTAKATELPGYIECKPVQKSGNKAYKIL